MIVAGCDVGSVATKVVIMRDGSIASYNITETKFKPDVAAKNAMDGALSNAGLAFDDIERCVSTGDGGKNVPFADKTLSQLLCSSKGAHHLIPSVGTVVDAGGNATRAISVDKEGRVLSYRLNDKCAAGAGRFFEVLAEALELKLDDLGPLSQRSKNPLEFTSQCTVFAESEVISFVNEGKSSVDIVAGINRSIASRMASLVKDLGVREDVVIVGGMAKNIGLVQSLGEYLRASIKTVPVDHQIVGALGAALLAKGIPRSERVG